MSYFAKIENNRVVQVISADKDFIKEIDGEWIETKKKNNYAGIGYSYDRENNCFVPERPYPSWSFNFTEKKWKAPKEKKHKKNTNDVIIWNEDKQDWYIIDKGICK